MPQALQQLSAAATPAAITTQHGLIWNTIEDFLTYGLPTPTNNWIGLTSSQYTAWLKQTTGLAYFSNGMASFGMSIGQQTFNGPLGTTAGSGGAFIPSPQFAALGAGGWHWHAAGANGGVCRRPPRSVGCPSRRVGSTRRARPSPPGSRPPPSW